MTIRRGEGAEVAHMRVSANLHAQSGDGRSGQIRRHHWRRAAEESKGRRCHAPHLDGNQLLHATFVRTY